MNVQYTFIKSLRQQLRDPMSLALAVFTPAAFVLLYWVVSVNAADTIRVGYASVLEETSAVIDFLEAGPVEYDVTRFDSETALAASLRQGAVDCGFVIREDFSLHRIVRLLGDSASPACQTVSLTLHHMFSAVTPGALRVVAGQDAKLRAFDRSVPALLVFAIIMLVFSTAIAVARETESGTLLRLRLARVRPSAVLLGIVGVQLVIGVLAVAASLTAAFAAGFRAPGGWGWLTLVAALGCVASVGLGSIVAVMARDTMRAFLMSSSVMFLLIVFSGLLFPRPEWLLFAVLPTTHVVSAFETLLIRGGTGAEIRYELVMLGVLSMGLLGVGARLFTVRETRWV